jgi:hypothetical protein
MLSLILSHWSVYLYLFYVAVLAVLFFVHRNRPTQSRDYPPL